MNQQNRHVLHLDRLRAPHPHADASMVLLRPLAALPESREQVAVSVFLVTVTVRSGLVRSSEVPREVRCGAVT